MDTVVIVVLVILVALNTAIIIKLSKDSGQAKAISELKAQLDIIGKQQEQADHRIRQEFANNRNESSTNLRHIREELSNQLGKLIDSNEQKLEKMRETIEEKLKLLTEQINQNAFQNREELQRSLEKMRETIEGKLKALQEDNSQKLEQMRATVDEKLQSTLEKRLGESFKQVSDRLEQVHKGLGEMQSLATGVGDLKKVLTNVKNRGILGEIQLENILEQILTPEQYEKNAAMKKGSSERVEFAIKLPGPDEDTNNIWLPIDSKFPLEDYQRLVDAYEQANPLLIEEAMKQLETTIKGCAKTIRDKYIVPPSTTDFAIMFLPIEGLYAEVLRRNGLFETLQRDFKVIVTGPNTLAALLNSLQMGFRTLAIQKRSSEVWTLLSAVKTEFGNFGKILDKTHKKLIEASNQIETASRKTRTIERKLRQVEELPTSEAAALLGSSDDLEEIEGDIA
ncbi:recombinase RmuC [Desulfuribacillus stibiiarsenatis]|uniref:Recombinase RmuC n=1 Tax=Desulfuribacillus stibiiarsenatis TaxID=1390249 RepID=A0A1E5LA29_9FIRM|nr:DNA recombination protein RmuC [Desulfuribacillus stibiiarsenatis]OEH86853.1 recombinase RmuC [Desulfuribacillus stibiiarsenatis]